jgi:hypothetical protein
MASESADEMTRLEVKKESLRLSGEGADEFLNENGLQGTSTFADESNS